MKVEYWQYPSAEDFTLLSNGKCRCDFCGQELETGIGNLSNHSISCSGKKLVGGTSTETVVSDMVKAFNQRNKS